MHVLNLIKPGGAASCLLPGPSFPIASPNIAPAPLYRANERASASPTTGNEREFLHASCRAPPYFNRSPNLLFALLQEVYFGYRAVALPLICKYSFRVIKDTLVRLYTVSIAAVSRDLDRTPVIIV